MADEVRRAIEAVFRIERARLIVSLARMVRDVDRAEELAQDALVVALSEWPRTGVPANPGAWLMAVAKRRAIDALRRDKMRTRKHAGIQGEIARTLDETPNQNFGDGADAIAACHARARRAEDTDWPRIAALYDRLRAVLPSPVVELNRAVPHKHGVRPGSGAAAGG